MATHEQQLTSFYISYMPNFLLPSHFKICGKSSTEIIKTIITFLQSTNGIEFDKFENMGMIEGLYFNLGFYCSFRLTLYKPRSSSSVSASENENLSENEIILEFQKLSGNDHIFRCIVSNMRRELIGFCLTIPFPTVELDEIENSEEEATPNLVDPFVMHHIAKTKTNLENFENIEYSLEQLMEIVFYYPLKTSFFLVLPPELIVETLKRLYTTIETDVSLTSVFEPLGSNIGDEKIFCIFSCLAILSQIKKHHEFLFYSVAQNNKLYDILQNISNLSWPRNYQNVLTKKLIEHLLS